MTNFLGRGVDIIGIRAVIQDVRQYQADGRTLVRVDEQIALAQQKTAAASVKAASVTKISDLQVIASKQRLKKAAADYNRDLIAGQKKLNDALDDLQLAQLKKAKSTQVIPKGQKGAGELAPKGSKFNAAGTLLLGGSKELDQAENKLKRLQKQANNLADALANIKADGLHRINQAGIAYNLTTERGANAVEAAGARAKKAHTEELQLIKRLNAAHLERIRIATQLSGVAVVATGVAVTGASLSEAGKYQDVLAKIDALTETTTEDTKALGEALLKQSQTLPVSATDQANAAFFALSSGIKDVSEAQNIATLSSKAQVAQMGNAVDISRVLTGVQNAYGKANIDSATSADILTSLVKDASVEAKDFVGEIGRVTGVSAKMNIKFSEAGAIIADLTNRQLSASEATTAYLGIINELEQRSPGQIEALHGVGLSFDDITKSIEQNGLIKTIVYLNDVFTKQGKDIKDVFPNIRAYNGFILTASDRASTATGIFNRARTATGTLNEAFDVSKGRISAVAQLLKNQLNVTLIHIGQDLIPGATRALQDLSTWFKNNEDSIRKFIVEGIQTAASIIKDFVEGLKLLIKGLDLINGGLIGITAVAPGAAAAVALVAGGLAWALPGGGYLKGLLLIIGALGTIAQLQNSGPDNSPGGLVDKFGLPLFGGIAGGLLGFGAGGPGGAVIGAGAGVQGGAALNKLLGLDKRNPSGNNTDKLSEAQKRADEIAKQLAASTDQLTHKEEDLHNPRVQSQEEAAKLAEAEKKAAKEAQALAQAFLDSSEAAGHVESLTAQLKLFGEITKQQADSFGLSAIQAGNVQGFDAIVRSMQRADEEAFNFNEALAAVAYAFEKNASVANRIVLDMANAAQEASQNALNALLSQPTREVADLGVGLARQKQQTTNLTYRNTPAINALNDQMKAIDRRIREANKQREAAQKAAERQNKANKEAADRASQQRNAMLDAMKLANLQAEIAAERQLAGIQKLIDANTKAQSDLQEAFLKSNEDLQLQINTAIGKGDTTGALALTKQQQEAAKNYQKQNKLLEKNGQALTTQQKQAQEAEAERQRQVRLNEALAEAQAKQQESVESNTESVDANTESIDANIDALEEQKQAIADQVDALQAPIDASKRQEEAIQNAIDLYESQGDVLKAQAIQADKTLKTQEEQWQLAKKLIAQIAIESGARKKFSDALGIDTIKEINDANKQFNLLQQMLKLEVNPALRDKFIDKGIDPATERLKIFQKALEDATASVPPHIGIPKIGDNTNPTEQQPIPNEVGQRVEPNVNVSDQALKDLLDRIHKEPTPPFAQKMKDLFDETLSLTIKVGTNVAGLGGIFRSIKPIDVIPENALQDVQEIQGEFFSLGASVGAVATETSIANTQADNLKNTVSLIKPPDVGDAGLQTLSEATTEAQNLGTTLALQVTAPDVGDAGKQTIDNATYSAQSLGDTLAYEVRKPNIGDAGRQIILDATQAARGLGTTLNNVGQQIKALGERIASVIRQSSNLNANTVSLPRFASGGFTPKSGGAFPAILHPNEVVLPLNDQKRFNDLLTQLSKTSGFVGSAGGGGGGGGSSAQIAGKLSPWQQALSGIGRTTGNTLNVVAAASAELAPKIDNTTDAFAMLSSASTKLSQSLQAASQQYFGSRNTSLGAQVGTGAGGGGSTGTFSPAGTLAQLGKTGLTGIQAGAGPGNSPVATGTLVQAAGKPDILTQALNDINDQQARSQQMLIDEFKRLGLQFINFGDGVLHNINEYSYGKPGLTPIGSFAVGTNYVPNDMLAKIHKGEMVIPAAQAKEIRTQLPPALYAQTLQRSAPAAVFAPTITVTGETLDTMEAAALNAVRSAFRDARSTSIRSGSNLAQNIGPGR